MYRGWYKPQREWLQKDVAEEAVEAKEETQYVEYDVDFPTCGVCGEKLEVVDVDDAARKGLYFVDAVRPVANGSVYHVKCLRIREEEEKEKKEKEPVVKVEKKEEPAVVKEVKVEEVDFMLECPVCNKQSIESLPSGSAGTPECAPSGSASRPHASESDPSPLALPSESTSHHAIHAPRNLPLLSPPPPAPSPAHSASPAHLVTSHSRFADSSTSPLKISL